MVVREIIDQCWRFRFDLSQQVLGIEVPEYDLDGCAFGQDPDLLQPTLSLSGEPVSAAMLLLKAKQYGRGWRIAENYLALFLATSKRK